MTAGHSIFRSAAVVSFFTVLSRIAGLARDMVVGSLLGTTHSADAYYLAYRIPNLLRRLTAEGAASAAFIPVFSAELKTSGKEAALRIATTCFLLLFFIMSLLTVVGIISTPWIIKLYGIGFKPTPGKVELAVLLTRIMFPYMLLISITALAMGVLNSLRIFAAPAASPVFLNLAIIFMACTVARQLHEPAVGVALGVVLGGIFQVLIQVPALIRSGLRFRWHFDLRHPAVVQMGRLMLPGLFGIGITQINVFIDTSFASLLSEGAVTALYMSDRLMEFLLGVYTLAIATAILPAISRIAVEKDWEEYSRIFFYGMRMVAFLTLPATAGLLLLRSQIIAVLFQRGRFTAESTALTATALLYFSLGLAAFSALKIVIPAYYARQDTRTPVKSALLALAVNLLANYLLLRPLGVGGPALATTLAAYVNFVTLYCILRRTTLRCHEVEFGSSLVRSLTATIPMGLFLMWVRTLLASSTHSAVMNIMLMGITIALAVGIYFIVSWRLGSQEVREFMSLMQQLFNPGRKAYRQNT